MAYIRDYAVTEYGAANIATLVCNMPVHESGDVLIYFASKDGIPAINATAGWTAIQDGASAGAAYRSMFLSASSSSETLSVITGTAENWTVVVVSIDGADGSSLANLIANSGAATAESASDDSTIPFDGPSTNTGSDTDCLIFHAWFTDSGLSPTAFAPLTNIYSGDNGANSTGVAYTFQRAAGAVAAASWYGRGADDGRGIVMAIKDSSSDTMIPPYSDPAVSSGQVLRPIVGLATMYSDSWPTSVTLTAYGAAFEANSVYLYEVAPSYTDATTAANSVATADVTWPIHVNDAVYFGHSAPFRSLSFITSTAGTVGTLAWEYWNGSVWTACTGWSNSLTATGGATVQFTNGDLPSDWTANDPPTLGSNKYWVRGRVTGQYTVAIVQSMIRLNGKTSAYIVAAASGDNGTNPYTDGCSNAGAASTSALSGCQLNFGSALDMDTGIIYGTIRGALKRDLAVDVATSLWKSGGAQVTFLDASNYYASYSIMSNGSKDMDPDTRNVWAIDWNGSATAWATGETIAKGAVTKMHLTTSGDSGASSVVWSMLNLVTRIGVAGGSSTYPISFSGLAGLERVLNYSVGWFPFFRTSGTAAAVWVPLQIGGGDRVAIECNLNTFQFPTIYDGVSYFAWNAAQDVAGIKFYPQADDYIKFTNCVFTSESPYRFEFDASSAASGWDGDFSGSTVINATVTLRDCMTFDNMAFISCPTFTANSATITNSSFTDTKVTCASPAAAAKISDCTFISGGAGHGIEISGTAANMTLDGVTFSGYSGTSTNAPIYVNIATGTMTIYITGGGSVPTIRTAGATVTVTSAVTVKVTVKDVNTGTAIENSRVLVEAAAGGDLSAGTDILTGLTNSSGVLQTTTFAYTNSQPVTGKARRASTGYGALYKTAPISGTITSSGLDVTVFLIPD